MQRRTDGFAITSLVLGCLGWMSFPGFFMAILAVVFGFLAQGRIRQNPSVQGKGMATAGIILGFVFIAIWVFVFLAAVLFAAAFGRAFRGY